MTLPERLRRLPFAGGISAEPLLGGLSNESWKVTDARGSHVVRFGRDFPFHHVDRAREVMTARAAHAAGFGPAVEHAEPGVSVFAFLDARTWGPEDLARRCGSCDAVGVSRLTLLVERVLPLAILGVAAVGAPVEF